MEISLKKCEKLRAKFATSKFEENLNLYKPVDIPTKRRVKTKLDVRYVKPDTSTQKDNRDEHKAENDLIARTHNLKLSGEQNSGDGKHIKNAILAKDGDENIDSDHHDRDCIFGWWRLASQSFQSLEVVNW